MSRRRFAYQLLFISLGLAGGLVGRRGNVGSHLGRPGGGHSCTLSLDLLSPCSLQFSKTARA